MTWMNRFDVEDAYDHYQQRSTLMPNAYEAAYALYCLMNWTDMNSDGWPYWTKPSKAAARLQEWLAAWRQRYTVGNDADLTQAELKAMLTPIRAFLTRQGADWREVLA